jgi:hypothetical protein
VPIASETLERIAGLYAIENDIRGRSADQPAACPPLRTKCSTACGLPGLLAVHAYRRYRAPSPNARHLSTAASALSIASTPAAREGDTDKGQLTNKLLHVGRKI